jgi:lipoprotein-anchoring transpeptidase ErfK/SrfK
MRAAYRSIFVGFAAALLQLLPLTTEPVAAREEVAFNSGEAPGTIVVRTSERRLYLVLGEGRAVRYPVGVGRAGQQWSGRAVIDGKHIQPAWQAPPDIARRNPKLAGVVIPGGSPRNPMGAAALTLSGGEYAIHGTNNPGSIGGFVSAGCIRMHNRDVMDLYGRVGVGTPVLVTR